MRYFEITDDLYSIERRWFLKSINIVDENKFSVWKFLSTEKIQIKEENISISIRENGTPLDFTFADFGVVIINQKVANLLNTDECQLIPVKINECKFDIKYYIALFLNSIDCVDENISVFEKWGNNDPVRPDKAGMYKSIYKLYIDPAKVGNQNIFRLGKYNNVIIINENLKRIFELNNVTGLKFKDVIA